MRTMGLDEEEDCDTGLGIGIGGHYQSHSPPLHLDLVPFSPVSGHGIRDVERACSRFSGEEEEGSGGTRKKLRLSKDCSAILEESFKQSSTLNAKQKQALAKHLNLRPRQVEVWFQNRRARTKLKQTEVDCEFLKGCYQSLTEENKRLQRELLELRSLKLAAAASPLYMQFPSPILTMCPSCERVVTSDNTKPSFTSLQKPNLCPPYTHSSLAC